MTYPVKSPKKLIEVALPLDEINKAAAREKSIRHGHPSTLHLWWARRPLAAARAVIFAQLVNDPSWKWELENPGQVAPGHLKASWAASRKRLFSLIEELVQWESTTKEDVLERARAEIRKSWREVCELNRDHPQAAELFNPDRLPALHDPFAGGGAIPLEAQRLGLEAYASDLNPVAVLINKAMIEIPPKFAGRPPVSLAARKEAAKEHKERKGKQESLFALSALSGGEVEEAARGMAAKEHKGKQPGLSAFSGGEVEEAARGMAAKEHKERKGKQESLFALSALSGGDSAWPGATGLAEDVRYYGDWMREEAQKRIGHLYPPVEITTEMARERPDLKPLVGQKLTVIAWLWARTVKSPNPAFSHVDVPLASTFILSSKPGKEAYVQPVVKGDSYYFTVRMGTPPPEAKGGTKLARANFRCIMSNTPISGDYIKAEGQARHMGTRLMAIVAEGTRGRIYLNPTAEMEQVAAKAEPMWRPDMIISGTTQYLGCKPYGMERFGDLFTPRRLVALTTFSDLVGEAREIIRKDALSPDLPDDCQGLGEIDFGPTAYADAVSMYLGLCVSRQVNRSSTLNFWDNEGENVQQVFARQALSMTWDFVEGNPFSSSTGNFTGQIGYLTKVIETAIPAQSMGIAIQQDAQNQTISGGKLISTDPPYYDNVPYADISDFFYVWLRRALQSVFPKLFVTMAVPKAEELVAFAYRHGGKEGAETFFMDGMTQAMRNLAVQAHPGTPITIYYAFRQSETETELGTTSIGWVTFLEAIFRSGFFLTGTWPMRTEYTSNLKTKRNALASSIVLVCRKRPADASVISRREFLRQLNAVLPEALDEMTKGSGDERSPVAPVDLSQAIIGPGMAVFSKYAAVLEADGTPMSVRTALQLINRFLAEDDFDADTQFCLHWFEQHGWREGVYGQADVLARAKGTSVDGMRAAGVLESGGGVVRLRRWSEYPADWDPQTDTRNPVWETLHHLIRALKQEGDSGAGRLLAAVRGKAEAARQLAYRLYTLCERQGWAEDARAYNELITSWDGVESAAAEAPTKPVQSSFLE